MGREVFLASFHPCFATVLSPLPPLLQVFLLTEAWSGRVPPLHPLPPILPTHSSSLALHLLGLNGSWECCDVMQWCTERTASLCFFFPHPLLVPRILCVYPTIFHFARVHLQHPSCLSQVFAKAQGRARPVGQICCKVVHWVWGGARRCTARHGWQRFIYGQRPGTCLRCSPISCYFDSCHLKENKTAAVIRVRGKSCFILAE